MGLFDFLKEKATEAVVERTGIDPDDLQTLHEDLADIQEDVQ